MPIHVCSDKKLFTLESESMTYQCGVDSNGYLLHLYYGKKIAGQSMDYLIIPIDRGFSGNPYEVGDERGYSMDTLPLEYPVSGVGDYRSPSLTVLNPDGSRVVNLKYESYRVEKGKYSIAGMPALYACKDDETETLVITLADACSGVKVDLLYSLFERNNIISRSVVVRNEGDNGVRLRKALSASLSFLYGQWDWIQLHGRHTMERQAERSFVGHGIHTIGSSRGASSHQYNPFIMVCEPGATEWMGHCYGLSLVYSGNFTAEIEKSQDDSLRVNIGMGNDDFEWCLESGESFSAPEVVMSYSSQGFSRLSQQYHDIYRNNLCRGKYKLAARPVLINNWEATYFDFDEKKLLEIAKEASELGIEMLVMDDGWFENRNGDLSGLGDWTVDMQKLPHGLAPLVERVNRMGLRFGIWFEPEMVNEDSRLYRQHPEWVLRVPGRDPVRSRYQLVLDLSREDVRSYLYEMICKVLDSANIEYVKWDMNRSISDWYSQTLPPERQGELAHRYVLGLYELLERLNFRYPDVLFEGCSGGGGRFDPGMLYYHPQIWCSDNTDAVERLKIQHGTSFVYPVSTMGSHVSAVPNHQTGRTTPLETRGIVAMSGSFGYELDLATLTCAEKRQLQEQVKTYKRQQDLLHNGRYYRLTDPHIMPFTAWMFVSEDKAKALLNIVVTQVASNAPHLHVVLRGLQEENRYRVGDQVLAGGALMNAGIAFASPQGDTPSMQVEIEKV